MDSKPDTPSAEPAPPFQLTLSDDKMHVYFTGAWNNDDPEAMRLEVQQEAKHLGIPDGVPEQALDRLQAFAESEGGTVQQFHLIEGLPPTDSIDGYIDWARNFLDTSFVITEDSGQIDYRKRRAQLTLDEGDLIARLVPAQRGNDGVDVFGKRVRARVPRAPVIIAGSGVRQDEEELTFFATIDGRFRWDGRRLDVDTVCTVDGDVGLSSGDIEHKGAVVVTGDVQEGATIRACGDIEVMGVVEGADVETAGSLMVRRGIIGRPGRSISAGRDVFARFIIEGHVTARGSVTAEREIVNSEIVAGGAVRVPMGRAFGGSMMAHGGMEAKALGSEGAVPTRVEVGEDPFLHGMLEPLEQELTATRERGEELNRRIRPLLARKANLKPEQKQAMAELLRTARALANEADRLHAEIEHLRTHSRETARQRVKVREQVYPEVEVHMARSVYRVKERVRGEFVFVPKGGGIVLIAK